MANNDGVTQAKLFLEIFDKHSVKGMKKIWTDAMANYKKQAGSRRPGETEWGFKVSTGISASLEAINKLQVAFVKRIKANPASTVSSYNWPIYTLADEHLKILEPAIVSHLKTVKTYVNNSKTLLKTQKEVTAQARKAAETNLNNLEKATKAYKNADAILTKLKKDQQANEQLRVHFDACLEVPLTQIAENLGQLKKSIESLKKKYWKLSEIDRKKTRKVLGLSEDD